VLVTLYISIDIARPVNSGLLIYSKMRKIGLKMYCSPFCLANVKLCNEFCKIGVCLQLYENIGHITLTHSIIIPIKIYIDTSLMKILKKQYILH